MLFTIVYFTFEIRKVSESSIIQQYIYAPIGRTQKYDSHEMIAEIFNNLDRNSESKYMSMLESNTPEAAVKIKDLMFTFEDLVKISSRGIQRLLRDVEKSKLTVVLKGASEQVKKFYLLVCPVELLR